MRAGGLKHRLVVYANVEAKTLHRIMEQPISEFPPFRGLSDAELSRKYMDMSVRDGVFWLIRETGFNGLFYSDGLIVLSPTNG
jgi:hypothetical protein